MAEKKDITDDVKAGLNTALEAFRAAFVPTKK